MNHDQVFFQREEDAVITDPQAVFAGLASQFLHIPLQVVLEHIESLADPTALLARQCTQPLQRLLTDLKPVDHVPIIPFPEN